LAFAKPEGAPHIPAPFFMNWISIVTNLLTAVNVIVCLLIILLVLLQRPKNEGLGAAFGGDTTSNIFGAQTTNVLATLTRWLGSIFLALCLLIAVLGTHDSKRRGKVDEYVNKVKQQQAVRDKEKAAEEAAKAASAAVEAAKNPNPPMSATSAPVPAPSEAPVPTKVEDKKPDAPAPAESKPAEAVKPADKPAAPESAPEPKAPAPEPAPAGN
jgi:preprotein translocase subunit SecG